MSRLAKMQSRLGVGGGLSGETPSPKSGWDSVPIPTPESPSPMDAGIHGRVLTDTLVSVITMYEKTAISVRSFRCCFRTSNLLKISKIIKSITYQDSQARQVVVHTLSHL